MKTWIAVALLFVCIMGMGPRGMAADQFKPFVTTNQKPKALPAELKKNVKEGMTLGALVKALGPGWVDKNDDIGVIRWIFSDGAMLSVLSAEYDPKEKLTFGEGDSKKGAMHWDRAKAFGF